MLALSHLRFAIGLLTVVMLASCDPSKKLNKDYLYFQHDREAVVKVVMREPIIRLNDVLTIQIYTKTLLQDQTALFNITAAQGYPVGLDGKIEIPVIGPVLVKGLTCRQLQDLIAEKLADQVKSPAVLVRFKEFSINVLGEVNGPGKKVFTTDKVTIIDALTASGDLTSSGVRENVTIIREEMDGVKKFYEIDLRSAAMFSSPVYQLQQNDIIYVNANKAKLKALKEKGTDPVRTLQTGLSFISVFSTLYLLFTRK